MLSLLSLLLLLLSLLLLKEDEKEDEKEGENERKASRRENEGDVFLCEERSVQRGAREMMFCDGNSVGASEWMRVFM